MDLDELGRLTADFVDAVDELNAAARRAGQTDPGAPLALPAGPHPLRARVERVLALQEEIVALLHTGAPAPPDGPQTLTVGLVVTRREWDVPAADRAPLSARARHALEQTARRRGLVVAGEPTETVVATEWGGAVITLTAPARPG